MLQFEEINFLGHSIVGLDIDTMEAYMQENGMNLFTTDDDNYWFVSADYDNYYEGSSAGISALQFKNEDYICSWDYSSHIEEFRQLPIGIRDIYTFDSLGEVLTKLGFSNSDVILDYIEQIRKEEYTSYDEIAIDIDKLSCDTDIANFKFVKKAVILDNGNYSFDEVEIAFYFYDNQDYLFTLSFGNDSESYNRLTRYEVYITH